MSDLLRLADAMANEADVWFAASLEAAAEGLSMLERRCQGWSRGLNRGADMARQMHADAREACDVAAGDVCGG